MTILEQTGRYCHFAWRSLLAAFLAFTKPVDSLVQFHNVLLGALPLGIVTGVALGLVVWIHLQGAVPEYVHRQVPEYLALAVVLEAAPLGAGLILAGRTGASFGAELGLMRLTEQIDALEVLGQSPMHKLVGPRVLACMIALPILTVFIAFVSIGSSCLAEVAGGKLTAAQYLNYCQNQLRLDNVLPLTLKTVVFGFLVAVTGCFYGMTASGGTEGVGRAATRSVVYSIFLVMVANVVLVKLIEVIW